MTTIQTASEALGSRLPVRPRRSYLPVALGVSAAGLLFSPVGAGLRGALATAHPHLPDGKLWLVQPMVIQVHVLAALSVVVLGAVLMLARKGMRFHRTAGWAWVILMVIVAGSSLFIVGMNGRHWSPIHGLSALTLFSLPLAVMAARRHDIKRHRRSMMTLFIAGPIVAGLFAFVPGRLMWTLIFG